MRCEDCRDAISARLDGEDPGVSGADAGAVDRHLEGCAACRTFADRAAHVTRLTRLRPAEDLPDVLPGLLDALDAGESRAEPADPPRRTWRALARETVRAALAVLAVGQLALALSGIVAAAGAGPGHLAGASIAHFSHESAAWNLALGVAFAFAAAGARRRAAGLVPVIGAFVALLVALSAMDLLAGHVEVGRLAGHLPVVAGLVLLLLHSRFGHDGGGRAEDQPPGFGARSEDRAFGSDGVRRDGLAGGATAHHWAA
jgi:predicted anti-sigma-YlaC factor YlaD